MGNGGLEILVTANVSLLPHDLCQQCLFIDNNHMPAMLLVA